MNLKNKVVLALLGLIQTANVWAMDKDMSPGMVPLGPFDFIPLLGISESHSDNIFYNNQDRKASLITRINGGGELALRRKLDRYALHYAFLSSQFHSSPADNYVDHNLGATAHFDFTQRNRLDFSSSLIYTHLMRGTYTSQNDYTTLPSGAIPTVTIPNPTQFNKPTQYHMYNANINYRYGRTDAPGNLGLQLGWNQLTYDNHLDIYAIYDNTQLMITPGFYWRLRPKTYLTTEIQNTFVHYPNNDNTLVDNLPISSRDYNLQRYLMGVTWDLSSKTKGSIHAGYLQQEYSSSIRQGASGLTYDGQVQWLPLTYSILSFNFSKNIQPIIGQANIGSGLLREVQVYNASWNHKWPNHITTELNGTYQKIAYPNTSQSQSRSDYSGPTFQFDVNYQMRSWLQIGVNYLQANLHAATNNSNNPNYSQNIFMLYVHVVPNDSDY